MSVKYIWNNTTNKADIIPNLWLFLFCNEIVKEFQAKLLIIDFYKIIANCNKKKSLTMQNILKHAHIEKNLFFYIILSIHTWIFANKKKVKILQLIILYIILCFGLIWFFQINFAIVHVLIPKTINLCVHMHVVFFNIKILHFWA